jgi:predicted metal-binding membrane protein
MAAAFQRGERIVITAGLLALTLLSWLYLALLADAMDAMGGAGHSTAAMWLMPMGRWGLIEVALCLAMWIVMMVAMMLPSAAPMLFAFHAVSRSRTASGPIGVRFSAFLLGYIAVWSAFSLLATGAQWALHEAAVVPDTMVSTSRILDAALLFCAGIFQFMALKQTCLSQCRSPMGFLLTQWRDGAAGALAMGWRHGMYCVGCCWALMALLFVGGVMNLLWIAVLSATVLFEKMLPFGVATARATGLAMIAGGLWVLLSA